MKTKYLFSIIIIFFVACKQPFELDKDFTQTKPVINCMFSPQDSFVVNLTQSRSPLVMYDVKFEPLANADIKIYENNVLQNVVFKYDSFYYTAQNFVPKSNCKYKIEVTTANGQYLTAEDSITNNTKISNYTSHHVFETDINDNIMKYEKVSFDILDNKNEKNYYWLNIKQYSKIKDSTKWNESGWDILSDNPVFEKKYLTYATSIAFSDEKFDAVNYNLSLKFYRFDTTYTYLENILFPLINDSTKIVFKLNTISESLYKYLKSFEKQFEGGGEIPNPLAEPIFLYSNVKEGFGIFGAYNAYVDSFTFKN